MAKLLCAPSLGGESFDMVLTRAFGCATPVVASDIPGYDQVMAPEAGLRSGRQSVSNRSMATSSM